MIQWDKNRFFEGVAQDVDGENKKFLCHDGDTRWVHQSAIFKIGEKFKSGDKVLAYWTATHKYLNPGKVVSVGRQRSYVEFDDGDKGLLPNEWIHKKVTQRPDVESRPAPKAKAKASAQPVGTQTDTIGKYCVIREGPGNGFHHAVVLEMENGQKRIVEKQNPLFTQDPWSTCARVMVELDHQKAQSRLDRCKGKSSWQVPRAQGFARVHSHAKAQHDGHFHVTDDNCQHCAYDIVSFLGGTFNLYGHHAGDKAKRDFVLEGQIRRDIYQLLGVAISSPQWQLLQESKRDAITRLHEAIVRKWKEEGN